jgi:hypothetical protein
MDPVTKVVNQGIQMPVNGGHKGPKTSGFEDVLKSFLQSTSEQMSESDRKTAEFG